MYDIGFSASESATQGYRARSGPFNVGGSGGVSWLPLALVALAALALWLWYESK